MKLPLSQSQVAKYAARLQGQRLFPLFRDWQIKRAIRKLVADGSPNALSALEDGCKTGLLARSPYNQLLNHAFVNQPRLEARKPLLDITRINVLPPDIDNSTKSYPCTGDTLKSNLSSAEETTTHKAARGLASIETFESCSSPIQLLLQKLHASTPISEYRQELRKIVHADSSRLILQQICELWASSNYCQMKPLAELLKFIELLPQRPLELRIDVALSCCLERQLADDGPEIAAHLIDIVQLGIHKESIVHVARLIRNDELKAEICRIWLRKQKNGEHNPDFEDLLCALDYLPKDSLEQRVFIALTCRKPQCLALEKPDVITYLVPLLEDVRLGYQAKRAFALLKDPETLKALNKPDDAKPIEKNNLPLTDHQYVIDETSRRIDQDALSREEELRSRRSRVNWDAEQADSIKDEQLDELNLELNEGSQCEDGLALVFDKQDNARLPEKFEEVEPPSADSLEIDHLWIKKLDQYVRLEHDERIRIISEIAKSDRSIDDWIEELLHQQEIFSCEEDVIHHSPDSEWLEDIDFAPLEVTGIAAAESKPQRFEKQRCNVGEDERESSRTSQQAEEPILLNNSKESLSNGQSTSKECEEQELFPFAYQTKQDILRITNCHPSALKKAAKELRCKAPFSLVDADRLAFALTGDASIRRVYMRRLEELSSPDRPDGTDILSLDSDFAGSSERP